MKRHFVQIIALMLIITSFGIFVVPKACNAQDQMSMGDATIAGGLAGIATNTIVEHPKSTLGGAAAGAAIGSIIPGVGTLIGGLAGAAIGGLCDAWFGD